MPLSSHTARVPAGGGTLWKSQPGGGKGHTDPCRPAPWTLRLQTARLGSIQQVRGINAAAESFWALLKEEIGTRAWPDRATARSEVFAFIETFYNRRRLRKHKVFGYLTPAETRQRHQHALAT
jgi:transposase InsO family protein